MLYYPWVKKMQSNRLFEIIYILLNKKIATARELAEHFGVSQRTIYRDIDTLSLSGVPVYTEKGKGGGISLLPDFVFNKALLSPDEQTEILSALQGLTSIKAAETDQVLKKLSALFNKSTVNWLEVDFSDWSYQNGGIFQDLKTAILERQVVSFDYYSTYGEKTERQIQPIQLWFKSKSWYVKGFCLTRNDVRLFKLTRIRALRITDTGSTPRNLLAAAPKNEPRAHQKQDVTLKLKIAPEMAYRVYDEFDNGNVEKLPDGSFMVEIVYPEDEWVYGTLLSFGECIEVLEPVHVRKILHEKAIKMVNMTR